MSAPTTGWPEPIRADHDLDAFDSAQPVLDDWLRRLALMNEREGASRTYVVCEAGSLRVVGYYCLSSGSLARDAAPGRVRRNMPDPVPMTILGRLAVDRAWHKQGLGRGLLRDAVRRTFQAAQIVGIRAILVHAISEDVRDFYERHGFRRSPLHPLTLMLPLGEAARALAGLPKP